MDLIQNIGKYLKDLCLKEKICELVSISFFRIGSGPFSLYGMHNPLPDYFILFYFF